MVEWLVGGGVLLVVFTLIAGIPYVAGWILHKIIHEQGSWGECWFVGAFVLGVMGALVVTPWSLGNHIMGIFGGG